MLHSQRSGGNSGSNWLHRLRSNKGFPTTGENVDLDDFLRSNSNSNNNGTTSTFPEKELSDSTQVDHDRDPHSISVVANVLSELFNMEVPKPAPRSYRNKSCRKQRNPKHYIISSTSSMKEVDASDGRFSNATRGHNDVVRGEMKGYSKNEVTVIDTSCQVWKFEKVVFRRKNEWEIRDKKGKSTSVWGKKKKKFGNLTAKMNSQGLQ